MLRHIEKRIFHAKEPIDINDLDIEHLLTSNKYSIKKKNFLRHCIGYVNHLNRKKS